MQESLISVLDFFGFAWWVEIKTDSPRCIYFFGPFSSEKEAEEAKPGYIEDLQQEHAQGITFEIKRCKPSELTVYDEQAEVSRTISRSFSSQMP